MYLKKHNEKANHSVRDNDDRNKISHDRIFSHINLLSN